jgi:ABC-type phosphate transport system substrate-binding protein
MNFRKTILSLALTAFVVAAGFAQEKPSPAKVAEGTAAGSKITINYSSPAVKGRTIWGDLVPMGQVWRAGANEATTFTTSKDITIQGQKLPAGTYGFFIIPNEESRHLSSTRLPNNGEHLTTTPSRTSCV